MTQNQKLKVRVKHQLSYSTHCCECVLFVVYPSKNCNHFILLVEKFDVLQMLRMYLGKK